MHVAVVGELHCHILSNGEVGHLLVFGKELVGSEEKAPVTVIAHASDPATTLPG